jgi:hypothetical protein
MQAKKCYQVLEVGKISFLYPLVSNYGLEALRASSAARSPLYAEHSNDAKDAPDNVPQEFIFAFCRVFVHFHAPALRACELEANGQVVISLQFFSRSDNFPSLYKPIVWSFIP